MESAAFMKIILIILLSLLLLLSVSCASDDTTSASDDTTEFLPTLMTVTTRDVPDPAPVPWENVPVYTEQTYEIEVMAGEEFAIGMLASLPPVTFTERYERDFLELVETSMVHYVPGDDYAKATDWYLFKAVKAGITELSFQYPMAYLKIFKIIIR